MARRIDGWKARGSSRSTREVWLDEDTRVMLEVWASSEETGAWNWEVRLYLDAMSIEPTTHVARGKISRQMHGAAYDQAKELARRIAHVEARLLLEHYKPASLDKLIP